MRKLFKDTRGGSNAIVFLVLFIPSVFILVAFTEPVKLAFNELILTQAYRKGLDEMQQKGGITVEIENDIKDWLGKFGFDKSKVIIRGTRAPVQWGNEIGLEIIYDVSYKKYNLENLEVSTSNESTVIKIDGSTTSYFSQR